MTIPPLRGRSRISEKGVVTNQGEEYQIRGAAAWRGEFNACEEWVKRTKTKGVVDKSTTLQPVADPKHREVSPDKYR
jgi:hypothetical protein